MNRFQEKQTFDQWWFKLIQLGLAMLVGVMGYFWFFKKQVVSNVVPDDHIAQFLVILALLLRPLIIRIFSLHTAIGQLGIHYQFSPIQAKMKLIKWCEIKECGIRKYSAVGEHGGWGYRLGWGGKKALTVKGNQGIFITLKNGKELLIGTQRPDEAATVINKYFTR